jgi:hypothetical protein
MKTLTAVTLVLAVFAVGTAPASATTTKKKVWHHRHYAENGVKPQVRGWIARGAGGHAYGYEYEPFLYRNGPYGNYPFFDDRNFWERVQSDPFSTRPGVSAY